MRQLFCILVPLYISFQYGYGKKEKKDILRAQARQACELFHLNWIWQRKNKYLFENLEGKDLFSKNFVITHS